MPSRKPTLGRTKPRAPKIAAEALQEAMARPPPAPTAPPPDPPRPAAPNAPPTPTDATKAVRRSGVRVVHGSSVRTGVPRSSAKPAFACLQFSTPVPAWMGSAPSPLARALVSDDGTTIKADGVLYAVDENDKVTLSARNLLDLAVKLVSAGKAFDSLECEVKALSAKVGKVGQQFSSRTN